MSNNVFYRYLNPDYYTHDKICKDKVRYTRRIAKVVASIMSMKYRDRMTAYKCKFCEHYHVGHVITPNNAQRVAIERKKEYNTNVLEEVQNDTHWNV